MRNFPRVNNVVEYCRRISRYSNTKEKTTHSEEFQNKKKNGKMKRKIKFVTITKTEAGESVGAPQTGRWKALISDKARLRVL